MATSKQNPKDLRLKARKENKTSFTKVSPLSRAISQKASNFSLQAAERQYDDQEFALA